MKKILALCDKEESYLYHMADYLEKRDMLPFTVHAFTDAEQFKKYGEKNPVEILLIAENAYEGRREDYPAAKIFILNESGSEVGEGIENINKYQASEKILSHVVESYTSGSEQMPLRISTGNRMKIIGNYTPIGRCLQTTIALSMGQLLAKKHRTLYLNFESYSGLCLSGKEFPADITDVLYYFHCEREKLSYRLEGMIQTINGLDYIPPVFSYQQLGEVTGEQWMELFRELERVTDYEYLILDLSEQMRGLFDILRECCRVFTIVQKDGFAEGKIRQYEALLRSMHYEDIAGKTRKQLLPLFQRLPGSLEQLTHGELAEYVKRMIEEEVYE